MKSSFSSLGLAASLALMSLGHSACAATLAAPVEAASPASQKDEALRSLITYVRRQNSTGLVIIHRGQLIANEAWAPPANNRLYANFLYGRTPQGALLEDVASQQKSFIAVLAAIAIDKGLLEVDQPVSTYLGEGWSKATPEQEAKILVTHILTMTSGLDESFGFRSEPGTLFFYNTPVYAVAGQIISAAAKTPLEDLTGIWLTQPLGMKDTAWRERPAALASVGNNRGLVTTPHDVARLGLMVLNKGLAQDSRRVVSEAQIAALFDPTPANPAYGRLWWLNGSPYTLRIQTGRVEGQLIPAAPADLVAAYGAFDRKLYVVPSHDLVVVRTGAATTDRNFDQEFWLRLMRVIG